MKVFLLEKFIKKKEREMKNKKKIIIICAAVLLVAAIAITIFWLNQPAKLTPAEKKAAVVKQITKTKAKIQDTLKSGDFTEAKDLLEQQQQNYKDVGNENGVIDTAAQLYLLEKTKSVDTGTPVVTINN